MAQQPIQGGPGGAERGGNIIGKRVVAEIPGSSPQVVEVNRAVFPSGASETLRAAIDRGLRQSAMIISAALPDGRADVEDITPRTISMPTRNLDAGLAPSGFPLNHNRSD